MKSPMLEFFADDPENYGELGVMCSAAGYYIGSLYSDPEMGGHSGPGTRDSDYYPTREAATKAFENKSWIQREHP